MTQASHAKPETKPTTSPATAGTPPVTPATANVKPGDDKAATTSPPPSSGAAAPVAPAVKKGASRIFIATGQVYEFETAAKAEKFLNGGGDVPAPADYAVLRGKRIGTSKK